MRRSLPTFLCVALATGLSACDEESVDGPSTDDELALFDYDFRSGGPPAIPGYPGNGNLTVQRASSSSGGSSGSGGGDIILFDLVNTAVYSRTGAQVATLSDTSISSTSGAGTCSIDSDGGFTRLRNADGVVLYSAAGPWVFSGNPDISGMNPVAAYTALSASLLVSFDDVEIVDGFASSGIPVAQSSAELDLATPSRKLAVTALLDGACGGEDLDLDGGGL
ncbi:MAG: hypothetical protein AB1Z98_34955 [Nannocystaceae bacterium]